MNAFDLLFGPIGPALKFIFTIGYIPNHDDFLKLTEEQHVAFVKQYGETNEKIFMFSPQNPNLTTDAYNEVSCISESEIQGFQDAANLIQQYCNQENNTFDTMEKNFVSWLHACLMFFQKAQFMKKIIICLLISYSRNWR